MRYEEKIIEHPLVKEESPSFKEAIVNIEFSQGDLIEMRNILRKCNSRFADEFLSEIEKTLEKVS